MLLWPTAGALTGTQNSALALALAAAELGLLGASTRSLMDPDLPVIPVHLIKPCTGKLVWPPLGFDGYSDIHIRIPLEPFDSGLDHIPQPETSEIQLYDFVLDTPDPLAACGKVIDIGHADQGGWILTGHRFNPCDVSQLTLEHVAGAFYKVQLQLHVDFEFEGVGQNAELSLTAILEHDPGLSS